MSPRVITPGWFSIDGAAIYTGFSVATIRKAIDQGLPAYRLTLGSESLRVMVRIRRETLDAWIEAGSIPNERGAA